MHVRVCEEEREKDVDRERVSNCPRKRENTLPHLSPPPKRRGGGGGLTLIQVGQ